MSTHDDTAQIPVTPPDAGAADDRPTGRPEPTRRPSPLRRHLVPGLLVLLYVVLVTGGITTSSLGDPMMRQDPASPEGITLGDPRNIRSDEWMVETPLLLGLGAAGTSDTGSPLAQQPDVLVGVPTSGRPFTSIVDFDASIIRLGEALPVASLFAARWWLPWLLLLLALPVWLRTVGATRPMSWLATVLVAAAPATAWWSAFPVRILGFAAAGCVLGMLSARCFGERRRVLGVLAAVGAGLLLARLGTWYIPWSITLAVPVVVATLGWLVLDPARRRAGLAAIAVTAVTGGALLGGLYLENLPALSASLNTVYPGQRITTGLPTALALLFGAPGTAYFQLGQPLAASNVSELSSAFTFAAVWALALFGAASRLDRAPAADRTAVGGSGRGAVGRWFRSWDADAWVRGVLAVSTVVWLVWCTVSLGVVGRHLPLLNRVPPERAAQTVGYLAVLLVALQLSRAGRAVSWRGPVAAAGGSAAVTAYGVSQLQAYAPGIGAPLVLGSSLAVFAVVLLVTRRPDQRRWVALTAVVAGLGVATVNPLQIGVGDLRDSPSAQQMVAAGDRARASGTLWASDDDDTDTLLTATGVPSLSGNQITGPEREAWEMIDPRGRYEDAWNRGGSSIEIRWLDGGDPIVTAPVPDQILLQADPCDLVGRGFPLADIISTVPLGNSCLTPNGTLEWNGSERYLYRTDLAG
jgi:hypothetical protein